MKPWYTIQAAAKSTDAEILLYGDIGRDPWTGEGIDPAQFARDLAEIKADHLHIRIHSTGGSVWDGAAIVAILDRHPARKTTYVDGIAASMASQILMVGDTRIISPLGSIMIHLPWTIALGNVDDFRDTIAQLERLEGPMIATYQRGMIGTTDDIRAALAAETWYNADTALAAGLVTHIGEQVDGIAALAIPEPAYRTAPPNAKPYLQPAKPHPRGATTPQSPTPPDKPKGRPTMAIHKLLAALGIKTPADETDEAAENRLAQLAAHYGDDTTAIRAHAEAGRDLVAALQHDLATAREATAEARAQVETIKADAETAASAHAEAIAEATAEHDTTKAALAELQKNVKDGKVVPPPPGAGTDGTYEEQWQASTEMQNEFRSAAAYAAYQKRHDKKDA